MNKLMNIMVVFAISLLAVSMVSALEDKHVKFNDFEVNGVHISLGDKTSSKQLLAVEEGEKLDIRVGLLGGSEGAKDIQVEAEIGGYEYDDYENLEDSTHLFDIQANTVKHVSLSLNLPKKLDKKEYWLRVRVLDSNSPSREAVIYLAVEPTRHGVDVKDVSFSPGANVKAGRSLLVNVLLENYGDKHEKDVKVTVGIPALGVSATEFVDNLKMDDFKPDEKTPSYNNVDYEDVPEMFLAIPASAAPGTYKLDVVVKYDDLRETVTKSYNIVVVENEMFKKPSDKLVLMVGPEVQNVAAGATAKYGVALSNEGTSSRAFTLETAASSGTVSVSENLVVLGAGQSKVVYVSFTPAANSPVGEQVVSVAVKSGSEKVETIAFKANVAAGSQTPADGEAKFSLRNGLEIALIVLVVLLVIIFLIVGFSRLRKDDEDEEQTYY